MRVISYIRLSSETQIDNQSAENQKQINIIEINKLKELDKIDSHIQPELIDDSGVSGLLEFKDRKFGKELLNLKENDYIFTSNIDRLARDNRIFENLIHHCKMNKVNVIVPNTGNITKSKVGLEASLRAVFAKEYARRVKENCRAGTKRKRNFAYHDFPSVRNGMGGKIPYGYRKEGIGKEAEFIKHKWLDDAVVLMKKLDNEGQSLRKISDTITNTFSMYVEAQVTHQTVNKILTDSRKYEESLAINQEVM
jgi:hypothetical protein